MHLKFNLLRNLNGSQRLMGCGVCSSFIHFSSARLPCCPYERVFALMLEHKLKSFSNKQTPR